MNLWQDDDNESGGLTPPSMTDLHFKISCDRLPIDHASALSNAVLEQVPWLAELPQFGVHPVHVAGSQNGWERPDITSNADLMLSKRTRLKIRINSDRADELVTSLSGATLNVHGNTLQILSGQIRPLNPSTTLFSRYTFFHQLDALSNDESRFIDAVVQWCIQYGYQPTKLLCGKSNQVSTQDGEILTRSVLLADVPAEHSLRLQELGIGDLRKIGCGIVIPHKDTRSVHHRGDD